MEIAIFAATMSSKGNTLIVITGATATGKSGVAVEVARRLGCEIISADSRQIYREIPIVSAAPTPEEMGGIRHHFIGTLPIDTYYSAARFESEVSGLLPALFKESPYAILCGGSMMYVDAVTDGIDELPDISPETREYVARLYEFHGIEGLMAQLEILDADYAREVDPANHKRLCHALEITLESGCPYSQLRTGSKKERPFDIVKIALDWPREELFDRINQRVGRMVEAGLIEEARRLYPFRRLNSLNTVGLKELFTYFDGKMTLDEALQRIAKNTRVYAKKQITWLNRPSVRPAIWIKPESAAEKILEILEEK